MAFTADLWWLQVGRTALPLHITRILNPGEISVFDQRVQDLARAIAQAPGPLSIDPSHVRLMFGVEIGLR